MARSVFLGNSRSQRKLIREHRVAWCQGRNGHVRRRIHYVLAHGHRDPANAAFTRVLGSSPNPGAPIVAAADGRPVAEIPAQTAEDVDQGFAASSPGFDASVEFGCEEALWASPPALPEAPALAVGGFLRRAAG